MTSPMASSFGVLCGKEPRFSSVSPDTSTMEMRATPPRDASTPRNLSSVKRSTRIMDPRSRVQMEDVEERIVELATVVYSRQAAAK